MARYSPEAEAPVAAPATTDDTGEADEEVTVVCWTDTVPARPSDVGTAGGVLATLRDRFAWLDGSTSRVDTRAAPPSRSRRPA